MVRREQNIISNSVMKEKESEVESQPEFCLPELGFSRLRAWIFNLQRCELRLQEGTQCFTWHRTANTQCFDH